MPGTKPVSLAVIGAGLIGRRHIDAIQQLNETVVCAIVDPAEDARSLAQSLGVDWFSSVDALLADTTPDGAVPDGAVIATPNQIHVEQGLDFITAGVPILVEKPLASDVAGALVLVEAGEASGVAVLTGHHRRHNPLMGKAREIIDRGEIGQVVLVNAMTWLYKPEDYFDATWRREPGAGPIHINLIHDVDALQFLCGPIVSVFAIESNQTRGYAVEDSAVITLAFASGALGTLNVSDTVVAPWSWELTARENPAYPPTANACYLIGGTHGSLELPGLRVWNQQDPRSWWNPIAATQMNVEFDDPLVNQIRQFAAVIEGDEEPLVSGRDGLSALRVIDAIKTSAAKGQSVTLD